MGVRIVVDRLLIFRFPVLKSANPCEYIRYGQSNLEILTLRDDLPHQCQPGQSPLHLQADRHHLRHPQSPLH